jgi:uncharacterized protein (DUF2147 family)
MMNRFLKRALALTLAGAMALPAVAAGVSPEGVWQSATGESRYRVDMCGDGTQLCAKLIWLSDDPVNNGSERYLNTYLIEGAEQIAANRWAGAVHAKGQTLSGTVTLRDADTIDLRGCLLVVFCKSFVLNRYGE